MRFLTLSVPQPQTVSGFKLTHSFISVNREVLLPAATGCYGPSPRILHLISSVTGNFFPTLSHLLHFSFLHSLPTFFNCNYVPSWSSFPRFGGCNSCFVYASVFLEFLFILCLVDEKI